MPPVAPSALTVPLTSERWLALRKILPPWLTKLLALIVPLFLTAAPTMPMRPLSASICPRLVAVLSVPVTCTVTPGVPVSMSCTVLPAASRVSPPGVVMMPSLVTSGAIR